MKQKYGCVAIAAGLGFFVAGPYIPVSNQARWVDPVTGSMKFQRRVVGFGLTPSVHPSAIEAWAQRKGLTHRVRWKSLGSTYYNFYGGTLAFACTIAPPIYPFHPDSGLAEDFVASCTDAEMTGFFRKMNLPGEQEAAVELAMSRLARLYEKHQAGP